MTELSISAHALDVECAEKFAELLSSPSCHLKALSLGDSTFGDAAMTALCRGIASNTTLTSLDAEHKVRCTEACYSSQLQQCVRTRFPPVALRRRPGGRRSCTSATGCSSLGSCLCARRVWGRGAREASVPLFRPAPACSHCSSAATSWAPQVRHGRALRQPLVLMPNCNAAASTY